MTEVESAQFAPRERPLTYPGRWPASSVLVLADAEWQVVPADRTPVGGYAADGATQDTTLDAVLGGLGAAPAAERVPVLAIGSNACGAQMRHKAAAEGFDLVVPTIKAQVDGLVVCCAPYVGGLGYVPATAARAAGTTAELFVQFLDPDQLAGVDRTEPGYRRVLLDAEDGVTVTLASGERLGGIYAYLADGGHLTEDDAVLPLGDQATLLDFVRTRSDALRDLLGDSAEEACRRVRDEPGLAAQTARGLREAGVVVGAEDVASLVDQREREALRYRDLTA